MYFKKNEENMVWCKWTFNCLLCARFFIYLKKKRSWDGQSVCKHTTTTMTLLHVLDYLWYCVNKITALIKINSPILFNADWLWNKSGTSITPQPDGQRNCSSSFSVRLMCVNLDRVSKVKFPDATLLSPLHSCAWAEAFLSFWQT